MNSTILHCALTIIALPLGAWIVLGLAHKRLFPGGKGLAPVATAALGASFALSLYIFAQAWGSKEQVLLNVPFSWLPAAAGHPLQGGIMVDHLTAMMLVVVTLVSFLVHLFSSKYMEGDVRFGRYYCGLLLFTTSMLGLVLANNMLYLYMFWELVGLSSYILIGHWYEKKSASDAAIKAFITTRVGDVGMAIGLFICYLKVGSLQYADLFAAVKTGTLAGSWLTIAGLGIFLGAMGKSAQFPLHVWLPDAMEGPTPVSALIHAATMVAAGVYLTGRMLPFFDAPTLLFIAYVGGFTAIFAASIALVQDDIKKVLAYSTVSQLGYMILALGVGGYVSGLFHLTTHAFFKAGLFLGSGAVIHAMHHEQSMSKYGGLAKKMPKTAICYLLATLALVGFPGFSGFWSKDAILADVLAFAMLHPAHAFLPIAGFATVFLTAFYMFRQFFLTFTGKPRDQHAYDHAHDGPWQMLLPLVVLGALAVVGGGFGGWFGGFAPKFSGTEQVRHFQEAGYSSSMIDQMDGKSEPATQSPTPPAAALVTMTARAAGIAGAGATEGAAEESGEDPAFETAHHKAHTIAMVLSTLLGLSGIFVGALFFYQKKDGRTVFDPAVPARRFAFIHKVLWNKYYFDELYMACFVMSTRAVGRFAALFDCKVVDGVVNLVGIFGLAWSWITDIADRLIVDGLFVNGSARATGFAGDQLARAQTGRVRQYVVLTAAGLAVLTVICLAVAALAGGK